MNAWLTAITIRPVLEVLQNSFSFFYLVTAWLKVALEILRIPDRKICQSLIQSVIGWNNFVHNLHDLKRSHQKMERDRTGTGWALCPPYFS